MAKITKDEALKIGDKILNLTRQDKIQWLNGSLASLMRDIIGVRHLATYKGLAFTLEPIQIDDGKKLLGFITVKKPKTELGFFIYEEFDPGFEKPIGCIEDQTFVKNLNDAIINYLTRKRLEEIKKQNKKIQDFINED